MGDAKFRSKYTEQAKINLSENFMELSRKMTELLPFLDLKYNG